MSIQYSGGALINRQFTSLTRADWVNAVTQALSDAGWTTISGTPGSGSDVKLESAAQNAGSKIRFRFLDPGSGNCAQVTMKNVAETATSQIAYCLPSAGVGLWRVIANKFHFFAFASGNSNAQGARHYVYGGTLWTPTFLNIQPTDPVGWMAHAGSSDTDATTRSWGRLTLRVQNTFTTPWWAIYQGNSFGQSGGFTGTGDFSAAVQQSGNQSSDNAYRWVSGHLPIYECFLSWGSTSVSAEAKLKGQLYDAVIINGFWTGESSVSLDGHTWMTITHGPIGGVTGTQCLFLAIT